MTKPFFLDTSIILEAVLGHSIKALSVVFESSCPAHTIEYVLKEVHFVLRDRYGYSEFEIARVLERLRERLVVHKNPPSKAFRKLDIRDKSDKPIVYAARCHGCILLINDQETMEDAQIYVEARKLED
jgi:predicted nucleic acid-binding protein